MTPLFRRAAPGDLRAIIALLADDELGAQREALDDDAAADYATAFAAIDADEGEMMVVAELDGAVMGVMQLSFLPGLSHRGALRGQIESIRIARALRGRGHGRAMIEWGVAECRRRGCAMVQLTSHRDRADALRFYETLGFTPSHIGFKRAL